MDTATSVQVSRRQRKWNETKQGKHKEYSVLFSLYFGCWFCKVEGRNEWRKKFVLAYKVLLLLFAVSYLIPHPRSVRYVWCPQDQAWRCHPRKCDWWARRQSPGFGCRALPAKEGKERKKERNREREMLLGLLCSFPVIDKWCENASCRRDVWRVDGVSLLSCPVLSRTCR